MAKGVKLKTSGKKASLNSLIQDRLREQRLAKEKREAQPIKVIDEFDDRFSNPITGSPRKLEIKKMKGTRVDHERRPIDRRDHLDIEDFEGHPFMLTQADRTSAGGRIVGLDGTPIDPVEEAGGIDYMFDNPEGLLWASAPNVVKPMWQRADAMKDYTGLDPILLPYSMTPTGGDFSRQTMDTMINNARSKMLKRDIKKIDSVIKKFIPSYKGVADPAGNAQLREISGTDRKAIMHIMDRDFRNVKGGISVGKARLAAVDADQVNIPEGQITNVGRFDLSKKPIKDSGHPTYIGGLAGEGLGTVEPLSAFDFAAHLGRPLDGKNDMRALELNPAFRQGIIDDKLLRRLKGGADPKALAALGGGTAAALTAGLYAPESEGGTLSVAAKKALEREMTNARFRANQIDYDRRLGGYSVDEYSGIAPDLIGERNKLRSRAKEIESQLLSDGLDSTHPARMERAKEQGFNQDAYHATPVWGDIGDIDAFDRNRSVAALGRKEGIDNLGTWVSDNPTDQGAGMYIPDTGSAIYPLKIKDMKTKEQTYAQVQKGIDRFGGVDEYRAHLQKRGYEAVQIKPDPFGADGGEFSGQKATIVLDPKNIRSVNAQFDPAKRDSANLLAGGAGAAVTAGLYSEDSDAMILGKAAKGADLKQLAKAQEMDGRNVPRETILMDTGWYKGVDGSWKWEISDKGSRLRTKDELRARVPVLEERVDPLTGQIAASMEAKKSGVKDMWPKDLASSMREKRAELKPLKEELKHTERALSNKMVPMNIWLDHPELMAQYPELFKQWQMQSGGKAKGKARNRVAGMILPSKKQMAVYDTQLEKKKHSTALHEVGHIIQDEEGFPSGGNSGEFAFGGTTQQRNSLIKQYEDIVDSPDYDVMQKAFNGGDAQAKLTASLANPDLYDKVEETMRVFRAKSLDHLEFQVDSLENAVLGMTPHQQYKGLAGEVDSRNIEARAEMDARQLRETPPWMTQDPDYPDHKQRIKPTSWEPEQASLLDERDPVRQKLAAQAEREQGEQLALDLRKAKVAAKYKLAGKREAAKWRGDVLKGSLNIAGVLGDDIGRELWKGAGGVLGLALGLSPNRTMGEGFEAGQRAFSALDDERPRPEMIPEAATAAQFWTDTFNRMPSGDRTTVLEPNQPIETSVSPFDMQGWYSNLINTGNFYGDAAFNAGYNVDATTPYQPVTVDVKPWAPEAGWAGQVFGGGLF